VGEFLLLFLMTKCSPLGCERFALASSALVTPVRVKLAVFFKHLIFLSVEYNVEN
jgi:hypothetical protein